jgi:hypothetical protein
MSFLQMINYLNIIEKLIKYDRDHFGNILEMEITFRLIVLSFIEF